MVCSPEQSRANGKLSKGPTSKSGKAIASHNATKHGILSQQPPLLATEDLDSFQGIIQGLVDEYQPETPTEQLLIQQASMSWLRLHRLWTTEAATANLEILKEQKARRYPYFHDSTGDLFSNFSFPTGKSYRAILVAEKTAIAFLLNELTFHLSQFPDNPRKGTTWMIEVQNTVFEFTKSWPKQTKDDIIQSTLWCQSCEVMNALDTQDEYGKSKEPISLGEAKPKLTALITEAKQHLTLIERKETELQAHEDAIEEAELNSKGLMRTELFSRYEQHITKQLTEALDRLATYQEQRNNKDPMGSFGKPDSSSN